MEDSRRETEILLESRQKLCFNSDFFMIFKKRQEKRLILYNLKNQFKIVTHSPAGYLQNGQNGKVKFLFLMIVMIVTYKKGQSTPNANS